VLANWEVFIKCEACNEPKSDQINSDLERSLLYSICNNLMYTYVVKKLERKVVC